MSSGGISQLKFKGQIYNVGDCLMLRESNVKILVCKLLEIIPSGGIPNFEEWPSIRVQWYYHWSELDLVNLGIKEQDFIYLGENELFYSDHTETVYIDSILGKCEVFFQFKIMIQLTQLKIMRTTQELLLLQKKVV